MLLKPEETRLVTDISGEYAHNRLYVETLLWKIPPGTTSITIGEKRAMQVNEYQKDPARVGLAEPRCRILIADRLTACTQSIEYMLSNSKQRCI